MRKRQISLTFETGLLATIAIALSLWTLLRLIGVATFAGAGCQQHGMHIDLAHIKEYCKIIKTTGYSGFANLLALATAAAGFYGALQLGGLSLYLPSALNFYYQYESADFAININLLMLILFLNAIGRYRNDF